MTAPSNIPSTKQPPLAIGGMSREGTTTVVSIPEPQLDYADKKVICANVCRCQNQPNIGKDGRSLRQECVSESLKALDTALDHRSPYKAEFTYDMTKRPPEPFLYKEIDTKSRELWPGWTKTLWPKDSTRPSPYKPGKGFTRRPDVVIVKDPTRAPTQDNIKQVVEIKFPGDVLGTQQRTDYIKIAGDKTKLVPLVPSHCDCDQKEPKPPKIPVEQLGPVAAVLGILYMVVTKRPHPGGVPAF